jgi:hypothetical protein
MNKLKKLITEVLSNRQTLDSCKSCNKPPILVESKQYDFAISEAMRYHIDSKLQLTENIYRPGSIAHAKILTEARILWTKGIIELYDIDKKLFENTDIGRWDKYEGQFVPLDLPMMEILTEGQDAVCATCGEHGYDEDLDRPCTNCGDNNWSTDYEGLGDEFDQVYEAKYQGKDVDLGKPKRGGSKKFYVYVKDPKTKKVKKVSFGMAGGALRAKLNNPKARKAFSDRMNCPQAKDKTTARYWSCRLPKYSKLLGFKTTFTGYW